MSITLTHCGDNAGCGPEMDPHQPSEDSQRLKLRCQGQAGGLAEVCEQLAACMMLVHVGLLYFLPAWLTFPCGQSIGEFPDVLEWSS